ncbi:MAG: DUF4374 domain-containing protein [Prevotellaceae bacterium]|nr:DUF4374 domain-containing protein [Prevotellaceae bacterium]
MKYLFSVCMAALLAMTFNACSDDDDKTLSQTPETPETPDEPDNGGTTVTTADYHFDLTITVGKHGGMARDVTTIVQSVGSLDADQGVISFTGKGCEINTDYTMETILKGRYYYQVPTSNDRFSKLRFENNAMQRVQEQKFAEGYTYSSRAYTHAWIGNNTLLVMAANGDKDQIIWTKLHVDDPTSDTSSSDDMTILDNGTLDIALTEGYSLFTSTGILTYRESDNKLFYFYYCKTSSGMKAQSEPFFHVVVIDPDTMEIESNETNTLAQEMQGSAYGELLQNTVMFDDAGNLYLCVFNSLDTMDQGMLLRINSGEYDFDPSYNGFKDADGKLLTVQYLGDDKALAYAQNYASGTGIDDYAYYYSIVDLTTGNHERLKYNGEELPYSGGRFSQRSCVVDGKAYIGVNIEEYENPQIYIYDIATGSVTKGAEIESGYFFEQIRVVQD